MAVRPTMAGLMSRVRSLIGDPSGPSETFDDQTIQDVLDESRVDLRYVPLKESPTYSGSTLLYLDYFTAPGNAQLEDGMTVWQFLTVPVTPSAIEPIMGHFQFAATTLPPVYLIGKSYDVYRAAADLLERWAARFSTQFDFSSDGQSFRVSQAPAQLLKLASTYRQQQRARVSAARRTDLAAGQSTAGNGGPIALDYFSSGDPGR